MYRSLAKFAIIRLQQHKFLKLLFLYLLLAAPLLKAASSESDFAIHPKVSTYKRVLTIAGSDSGGGAGIQADIKTLSALGCYATNAISVVTAQNTLGVSALIPLSPELIQEQINKVWGCPR